jgi:RNA polymerase sigma factor (sigma-70 family)
MAAGQLNEVLDRLRRAGWSGEDGPTDAHLLECFVTRRDAGAFAVLVRRHGPMVYGVCRRLLRNHHDAEDAFQATFLVLAHKAASVVPRRLVGNWLYGVAYHTALKARADVLRRRAREQEAATMPRSEALPETWRQLEPLLDAALKALPDKYRATVVLCDLEGKTRKEAARQLDCPEGTVASRLVRARQLLARRMTRHGLALSATALAAALSQGAASAGGLVPAMTSVIQVAAALAAGKVPPAGAISARVAALKEGVLKAMLLAKLKVVTLVLVVLAVVGAACTLVPGPAPVQAQKEVPRDPTAKAVPAPQKEAPPEDDRGPRGGYVASMMLQDLVLEEVDVAGRTLSAAVAGGKGQAKGAKLLHLPVAKDATFGDTVKLLKFADLKPGMRVSVQLAVDPQHRLVVAGVLTEPGAAQGKGPADRQAERQALLEEAKAVMLCAEVVLAQARADQQVVAARVELARATLLKLNNQGTKGAELNKAKAEVEVAQANDVAARVAVQQAEADLAAARAAYERAATGKK